MRARCSRSVGQVFVSQQGMVFSENRYPLFRITSSHRNKKVMAGTSPAITVVALSLRRLVSSGF
jgi:hypothetical protein